MKDLVASFDILQVILFITSAITIFVKRNKYIGVKLPYTLADDEIWRAVNRRFGILICALVLFFSAFAFILGDIDYKSQMELIVPESVLISAIMVYCFIYAKKLYIKKYPDSTVAVEVASKSGKFSLNKINKFDLNFFFLYILVTALIFQWQYDLALPLWNEKVATHWGIDGVANGWMYMSASFKSLLFILPFGFCGVVAGYILSKFFDIKKGFIFTPFSISILWGFASTFFFAMVNDSVYRANLNSQQLEIFSGLTGVCAIFAIVFFALFIIAVFAASIYISIAFTKQIQKKL